MKFTSSLTSTRTLWILFVLTILITAAFPLLAASYDLTFLDGISSPQQVRAVIDAMTDHQRLAHAWITGTVDVAYPLAYGLLFAGSAMRFFPGAGLWLALPGLLAIPVDLIEGVIQILALLDQADLVSAKLFITPTKTVLFLLGLIIMVCGWIKWVYLRLKGQNTA